MSLLVADVASSLFSAVGAASAEVTDAMKRNQIYRFSSTTACYIKQAASSWVITCLTKANFADTDYFGIAVDGAAAVLFEFDKAGDGVTAGRTRVNISGATTAADCAAILAPLIQAAFPYLKVTDNLDGTITVVLGAGRLELTENVANASFTVVEGTNAATAGAGSMFIPANLPVELSGSKGGRLAVIQSATGGSCTLTRMDKVD